MKCQISGLIIKDYYSVHDMVSTQVRECVLLAQTGYPHPSAAAQEDSSTMKTET